MEIRGKDPTRMVKHPGTSKCWTPLWPIHNKEQFNIGKRVEPSTWLERQLWEFDSKNQPVNTKRKNPLSLSLSLPLLLPLFFSPFTLFPPSVFPTHQFSAVASVGQTKTKDGGVGIWGMMQLMEVNLLQPRARCRRKPGGRIGWENGD